MTSFIQVVLLICVVAAAFHAHVKQYGWTVFFSGMALVICAQSIVEAIREKK